MPPEIFKVWRAEIETELQAARSELQAAQEERFALQEASDAARAEQAEISGAIKRVMQMRQAPLGTALAERARRYRAHLDVKVGRWTCAKQRVANAAARVEDLTVSLEQIREIDPPPAPVESLEAAAA